MSWWTVFGIIWMLVAAGLLVALVITAGRVITAPQGKLSSRDRAYIVGTLGRLDGTPIVRMVGIYSHSADNLTSRHDELHFDIASVEAESFHEAHIAAEQRLQEWTHLRWAWQLYKHPWPKLEGDP